MNTNAIRAQLELDASLGHEAALSLLIAHDRAVRELSEIRDRARAVRDDPAGSPTAQHAARRILGEDS